MRATATKRTKTIVLVATVAIAAVITAAIVVRPAAEPEVLSDPPYVSFWWPPPPASPTLDPPLRFDSLKNLRDLGHDWPLHGTLWVGREDDELWLDWDEKSRAFTVSHDGSMGGGVSIGGSWLQGEIEGRPFILHEWTQGEWDDLDLSSYIDQSKLSELVGEGTGLFAYWILLSERMGLYEAGVIYDDTGRVVGGWDGRWDEVQTEGR